MLDLIIRSNSYFSAPLFSAITSTQQEGSEPCREIDLLEIVGAIRSPVNKLAGLRPNRLFIALAPAANITEAMNQTTVLESMLVHWASFPDLKQIHFLSTQEYFASSLLYPNEDAAEAIHLSTLHSYLMLRLETLLRYFTDSMRPDLSACIWRAGALLGGTPSSQTIPRNTLDSYVFKYSKGSQWAFYSEVEKLGALSWTMVPDLVQRMLAEPQTVGLKLYHATSGTITAFELHTLLASKFPQTQLQHLRPMRSCTSVPDDCGLPEHNLSAIADLLTSVQVGS